MKIVHIFRKPTLIALCILGITSCEKTEPDTEILNIKEQEGFMSTTGNSNTLIAEDQSEVVKPIFHMSFSSEIGEEEATIRFEKALAEHNQKMGLFSVSGPITKIPFRIFTITSSDTHSGTNGAVKIDIVFKTNEGIMPKKSFVLLGDREEGSVDLYNLELTLPNPIGLKWMKIESATIKLQGTNGWRFEYLSISGNNTDTDSNMSLYSKSGFLEWLDGSCNSCWDSYTTIPDDFTESDRYYFE